MYTFTAVTILCQVAAVYVSALFRTTLCPYKRFFGVGGTHTFMTLCLGPMNVLKMVLRILIQTHCFGFFQSVHMFPLIAFSLPSFYVS